jgi:hypothetical protein
MAYFPDLSPYAYGRRVHCGVVHVGWLDGTHPFSKGSVERRLIEKMKVLAEKPVELYRGFHTCELCVEPPGFEITRTSNDVVVDPNSSSWAKWSARRKSNGEIRVTDGEVTFAAPVLIVHYIEEHHYLPPPQFLKAIEDAVS